MNFEKYLVKLTPLDYFFFGGENTFGGRDGSQSNYLVRSQYYPQQTALLGLVRHQLLLQNGLLVNDQITNHQEAALLIGERSFYHSEGANPSFGAIRSLTGLMYARRDDFYFPAGRTYGYDPDTNTLKKLKLTQQAGLPLLKDYSEKGGVLNLLGAKGKNKLMTYEEHLLENIDSCYLSKRQQGIHKNYQGKTEEKAYFIQTVFKLTSDCAFAFVVELATTVPGTSKPVQLQSQRMVRFGGEQSTFRMEVTPFQGEVEKQYPVYEADAHYHQIILLSDAYLPEYVPGQSAYFANTAITDFRCLQTEVRHTSNYATLGAKSSASQRPVYKSKKLSLLQRGSVFYGKDHQSLESLAASLEKETAFRTIGYNQYVTVPAPAPASSAG